MIIKTKKYSLPPSTYIKITFFNAIRRQWWLPVFISIATAALFFYTSYTKTSITLAIIGIGGFFLFHYLRLYAVTKVEQNKLLFSPLYYQITSKQIVMHMTTKQGMPIEWNQIKQVRVDKNRFLLFLNPFQFICLPFRIFSEQELRFMKMILKRKGLIK